MIAVQENGLILKHINRKKRQTPKIRMAAAQIFLAAVQQNGLVLEYIKKNKQTLELCTAAIQQNIKAIDFIKIDFTVSYYKESVPPEDDVCPICLDDESTNNKWCEVNKCKHKHHISCIEKWLKVQKTCSMCKGCLI